MVPAGGVLELAQDNRLLKAVVSATHGADTELLPLLTTHSESLLETAKAVVRERVAAYPEAGSGALPPGRLDAAIDLIVRVVLSHVMQPSGSPQDTADDIAWLAAQALAP